MKLSTSRLELAESCAASPGAYANLPEGAATAPMLRGTALHLAFQRMVENDDPELTTEQEAECRAIYAGLTQDDLDDASASYFGFWARRPRVDFLGAADVQLLLEPELDVEWLGLESEVRADGSRSNRADAAWVVPGFFAVVWENKFGVGHGAFEVPHPSVNRQIQAQVVSLAKKYNLENVQAFLCQPKVWTGKDLTEHLYDFEALELAEAKLRSIVARSRDPKAAYSKGEHCRKCPAAASCPARQDKPAIPDPRVMSLPEYLSTLDAAQRGRLADDLVAFRDWAQDGLDVLKDNAARLPVAGWGMADGKQKPLEWTDEDEARKALKRAAKIAGLKEADLMRLSTPTQAMDALAKSVEALAEVHDLAKRPPSTQTFKRLAAA